MLDKEFPGKVPLHLVMDNYGTHKQEGYGLVEAPSSFRLPLRSHQFKLDESRRALVWTPGQQSHQRGVFLSVADLQTSIAAFLSAWNESPKPFVWTATVESIQEKLSRCRRTLEQIQPGCTSPKARNGRKRLYSYFADTTLANCKDLIRLHAFKGLHETLGPDLQIACRSALPRASDSSPFRSLRSSDGGSFRLTIRTSISPSLSKSPNAQPRLQPHPIFRDRLHRWAFQI